MAKVRINIIGGGAGGGYETGGGGAAGGFVEDLNHILSGGVGTYPVVVGTAGSGGTDYANVTPASAATSGGNSSFDGVTAYGGGHGGDSNQNNAASGGSGGGSGRGQTANAAGTAGQGNQGGQGGPGTGYEIARGGGGGGASSAGVDGSGTGAGNGGNGIVSSIDGVTYCGGGGGGIYSDTIQGGSGGSGGGATGGGGLAPSNATGFGSGGGGGGLRNSGTSNRVGSNGSPGKVIIEYLTSSGIQATGGTKTTSGSYTRHVFTSNGNFIVTSTGSSGFFGFM